MDESDHIALHIGVRALSRPFRRGFWTSASLPPDKGVGVFLCECFTRPRTTLGGKIRGRHNSAYVRFRGLIVIKMTLCVMMNRTMVAHRENPRIERSSGGRSAGLFGRACRRLPVTSTCSHTLQALPDVHLGPIAAPGFDAELLVPSPRVFHIPLRYSRPRRV